MSNINPNNIDGTYPVAGQDNDSQGFRDNFTNVRNNFTFAKGEIEDLAAKVILKQALVGGTLNNDLAGTGLIGATVSNFSELRKDFTTVSGSQTVNYAEGHFQKLTTGGPVSISFSNWPASGKNGRMRLQVQVSNTAHTVTITDALDASIGTAIPELNGGVLTFEKTGTYVYEFESDDGGSTLKMRDLYRGNLSGTDVITTAPTTSSAALGDVGLGFVAIAGARYSYTALVPISHDTTDTTTFSVSYTAGAGYAVVEQQTAASSAFESATIAASDAAATTSTGSISTRMVRVSGVFHNSSGTNQAVNLRFATAGGILTVLAGATLTYTRLA